MKDRIIININDGGGMIATIKNNDSIYFESFYIAPFRRDYRSYRNNYGMYSFTSKEYDKVVFCDFVYIVLIKRKENKEEIHLLFDEEGTERLRAFKQKKLERELWRKFLEDEEFY